MWSAGRTHRLRLINITPDDLLPVALVGGDRTATWHLVAKDGALTPTDRRAPIPATGTLAVSETLDVEYDAAGPGILWLDVTRR